MAEENDTSKSTPVTITMNGVEVTGYWEAYPLPPTHPPITDEQRAQWAEEKRQREAEALEARNTKLREIEQRPFMRLQIWRVTWRRASFEVKPVEIADLETAFQALIPPIDGALLREFQAQKHGDEKAFQGWFIDVVDLAQLKRLINSIGLTVMLEPAVDGDIFGGVAAPDADYILTIVDDWVEVNS